MTSPSKAAAARIVSRCIGFRARRLMRVVSRLYDEALRDSELTVAQLSLLAAIELQGPVQPGELAQAMDLEKSTLSRNVKLMVERGLLRISEGETGRAQTLELTALIAALPAWEQAQQQAGALLGPDAAKVLDRLFES
jgi:DNA-binding MarR family transcriptional regulator